MIDIFELVTPPGVVAKLGSKHGLSVNDLEDALDRPYRAVWLSDPPRLLVKGRLANGRAVSIVLIQDDGEPHGTWRVLTAFLD